MLIRRITREDNGAVAEIIRTVMTEFGAVGEGYSIEDPEVDAMFEAYDEPRAVFYVLEENRQVVGCGGLGQLVGADHSVCELKKMYFYDQARGRGLGRMLAETLLVDARRLNYARVYIETLARMSTARKLYEKLGFEQLDSGLGNTGHSSCDTYYALDLEPQTIDPSLLA